MIELGNVGVGDLFVYDGALFVVMPFNWEENKYKNLCIAVKNPFEYDKGNEYCFMETTMVQPITKTELKQFIP